MPLRDRGVAESAVPLWQDDASEEGGRRRPHGGLPALAEKPARFHAEFLNVH